MEIEFIQLLGRNSFHTGIDLAGEWHTNIMSVLNGTVVFAGVLGGYGNCVKIEHKYKDETIYSLYAHLAEIKVYQGQSVIQGNVIGTQGGDPNRDENAGTSTGSHLHFEIRKNASGNFQNPRDYLYGGGSS